MSDPRPPFLSFLAERVVVFDGATGSNLHELRLSPEDFEGAEGCNEILSRTRPDVVRALHASFLEAGCHVVETNTLGANRIVLKEYGLESETRPLNALAAGIARGVALDHSTPDRPRYVAGSVGPGTKLPSLGHIDHDTLVAAYREQIAGLLEGGVDLLIVETCQDLLQIRAAIRAAREEMRLGGRLVPLVVSLTMERTGTMLLGTELAAALSVIVPLGPDVLGLNCATGPLEMKQHLQLLFRHSPFPISVQPNAGLPESIDGRTRYPLTPDEFARWHASFILEEGVQGGGRRAGHARPAMHNVACSFLMGFPPELHHPLGVPPRGHARQERHAETGAIRNVVEA